MGLRDKIQGLRNKPVSLSKLSGKGIKRFSTVLAVLCVAILVVSFATMFNSVDVSFGNVGIVGTYVAYINDERYRSVSFHSSNLCYITNYTDIDGNVLSEPMTAERRWRLAYESKFASYQSVFYVTSPFVVALNTLDAPDGTASIETFFFIKDAPSLYSRPTDYDRPEKQFRYAKQ